MEINWHENHLIKFISDKSRPEQRLFEYSHTGSGAFSTDSKSIVSGFKRHISSFISYNYSSSPHTRYKAVYPGINGGFVTFSQAQEIHSARDACRDACWEDGSELTCSSLE